MNLHDPMDRLGRDVPFSAIAEDYTLAGAHELSCNCTKCSGCGFAPIFNPRFDGRTIGIEINLYMGAKPLLMRANAFCVCPLGRKIAMLNQKSSQDFFLRTPDLHDVIAGRYPHWVAEDPRPEASEPIDVESLPRAVKRLANALRVPRIYREPEPYREEINAMFDEASHA
jgi:hypothetical protein